MANVTHEEFRILYASRIRAKRVSTNLLANAPTWRIPKPAARHLVCVGFDLRRLRAIRQNSQDLFL